MDDLKLIAFDGEDLTTLSAHMQDAIIRVGDIAYLPRERRFVAIANRFDWQSALDGVDTPKSEIKRRRTALRFEYVNSARLLKIKREASDAVLELLNIEFNEDEAPNGTITLNFSGGGAIELKVECIEAQLSDLGPVWRASSVPAHSDDDAKENAHEDEAKNEPVNE